jgi:hypothetical protein
MSNTLEFWPHILFFGLFPGGQLLADHHGVNVSDDFRPASAFLATTARTRA